MKYDYDMTVIGGGAAGLTAAGMAAVLGAKTTLIEAKRLGGDCTWHGCVPSKSLLHAAKIAHRMRTASQLGLTAADPKHDLSRVMAHVHSIRQRIYEDADAPPNFERLGVEVRLGRARFLDRQTLEVTANGAVRKITSQYFIIATGSTPRVPRIEGMETAKLVTNETLFDLERLPDRLLVMGGGPIGIEMAQAFCRLGSRVTVVNRASRILGRDDSELSAALLNHLRAEGIQFIFGTDVGRVDGETVWTRGGQRLEADVILAAVGRQPSFESLNVAAAGVASSDKGILVDKHCKTSAKRIYAVGDVAGRYLFTHMAEHMAKIAVTNAILHLPASLDDRHVTWCTFTDPELAQVGRTEDDLKRDRVAYSSYRFPFTKLDRAITESEPTGLIKVFSNRWGKILGVSILGANAGEMIGEYALAMRNGVRLRGISSTIHPYPTYVLGNRRAADLFLTRKLTPKIIRQLRWLLRLHGDVQGITSLNQEQ